MTTNIGKNSSRIMFCLLLISIFTNEISATPAILSSPTDVVNGIVEGGNALNAAIEKFEETRIDPILKELQDQIEEIKRQLRRIPYVKQNLVRESLGHLYNGKSEMTAIRRILSSLARETISTVGRMKKILSAISPDMSLNKIERLIELPAKNMAQLLGRSNEILYDAQNRYHAIKTNLGKIKSNLDAFADDVNDVMEPRSEELEAWISDEKRKLNLACTPSLLNIVAAGICYGTVNGVLDTKAAQLRAYGRELEALCKKTIRDVNGMSVRVENMKSEIEKEQEIITNWQRKLSNMKVTFDDEKNLATSMSIKYLKEEPINMLNSLKNTCNRYLKHVSKK